MNILKIDAKANDTISIFADLKSKCLKGSDANLYMKNNFECLSFIGNGWLLFDRDQIFKKTEIKSYFFNQKSENLMFLKFFA